MDNNDRKNLYGNEDLNGVYNKDESFNTEKNTKSHAYSKFSKTDTKNKLIIVLGIVAIALIIFFLLNKFVFSKTSEGFPKGQLLEQQFSPNNANIMRVYGDTNNPVTSTFIRIEVESVQKKTTIYYQDSINPANIDYKWSNDSDSIIINGVAFDKTKTFKDDSVVESVNDKKHETIIEKESIKETDNKDKNKDGTH